MDYEKKYKQLYTLINDLYPYMSEYCKEKVEGFFPELAESEDERIRKWCISHLKAAFRVTKDNAEYQEYLNNKVISWLEKQGETYTKKDVDDAWVEGVCYARRELEKQDLQNLANSAKTCKSE